MAIKQKPPSNTATAAKSPTPKAKPAVKAKVKEGTAFIYRLVHPDTREIAYIGKATDLRNRLARHLKPRSDQPMTPVKAWIISLLNQGKKPIMELVEECDEGEWQERERFHIEFHRQAGHKIKNLAKGGDQPACSLETRKQNAELLNSPGQAQLNTLMRALAFARRARIAQGRHNECVMFDRALHAVRMSTGAARQRFIQYAQEKYA